ATEKHILIENGDAEEFWEVPDLSQPPSSRLDDILRTHASVYRKLKRLHAEGRYYRTQGNHDGPLREQALFDRLRNWEGGWQGPEQLQNYDFLIIPGVKTMDEFRLFDLLTGARQPWDFVGLDASAYTNKKCVIVCHGHQFDFWNAKENELFGRVVTAMI